MARSWEVRTRSGWAPDRDAVSTLLIVAAVALVAGTIIVLAPETASSLVAALVLSLIGARVARALGGSEAQAAVAIFVGALAVRMLAMLLLHELVFLRDPTVFAGDDRWYDLQAGQIAAGWRGEGGIAAPTWFDYRTYVAALSFLSDGALLVPRIVNVVLGSLAAVAFALLAGELFGPRAMRWTGVAMALWPSAVLWTSLNLREAWVLLGFGLVGLGAARWFSMHQRGALVIAGVGVALVGFGRSWILFVAAIGLAAGWLVSLRRRPAKALVMAGVLGGVLWMLFSAGIADRYLLVLEASGIAGIREQTAIGSSALVPTSGGVPGLMFGLVNSALRPLPWDAIDGLRQLLAMPETLIWYALLLVGLVGAWRVRRRHPEIVFPMLGAAAAVFIAIALLESNEGLIYRHRLPAVAVIVMFAVGWLAARHDALSADPA